MTIKYILKNILQCSLCSVVSLKNIKLHWNNYILDQYNTTLHTHTTHTTETTETTQHKELFDKIHASNIQGRSLELFLPLFFISNLVAQETLVEIIDTAKDLTLKKKQEQEIESIDVMVYDFIAKLEQGFNYYSIKQLTIDFRNISEENGEWLNAKWLGRALKRLNLILEKRRKSHGMEVILNVAKAKEKLKMFKEVPDEDTGKKI